VPGSSATEIIQFFGYPRSTIYDVAKYMALEQSNKGSSMPVKKSRKNVRIPAVVKKGSSADFGSRAIVAINYRKLASIVNVSEPTIRRIAEQDLRYKSYTLKIRQMLSEAARTSQVARLPF